MPAPLVQIADTLTADLEAAAAAETFAVVFTPERRYLPAYDLHELTDLAVTVVPHPEPADELASRDREQHDARVWVAVQQRVDPDDNAAIDALMDLVEQLKAWVRGHSIADATGARYVRLENKPAFSPEKLRTQRLFTSVITVTYRKFN